MACASNFSAKFNMMPRFITRCPICTQCKHASSKTGQMSHFVFKQATLPFSNVCQTSTRFPDQMGFYGLQKYTFSNQIYHFVKYMWKTKAKLYKRENNKCIPIQLIFVFSFVFRIAFALIDFRLIMLINLKPKENTTLFYQCRLAYNNNTINCWHYLYLTW